MKFRIEISGRFKYKKKVLENPKNVLVLSNITLRDSMW